VDEVSLETELNDDFLKMVFACCHPQLPMQDQIILVLKILIGFSTNEIARALLKSPEAIT
ncbi:MAG: RNA polymerase subunit sigma-24, partial [Fulvivirga sp.]|nr:RNA polymerase subunit sigma-24 [Fulvivirga sp.]